MEIKPKGVVTQRVKLKRITIESPNKGIEKAQTEYRVDSNVPPGKTLQSKIRKAEVKIFIRDNNDS